VVAGQEGGLWKMNEFREMRGSADYKSTCQELQHQIEPKRTVNKIIAREYLEEPVSFPPPEARRHFTACACASSTNPRTWTSAGPKGPLEEVELSGLPSRLAVASDGTRGPEICLTTIKPQRVYYASGCSRNDMSAQNSIRCPRLVVAIDE